MAESVIKNPHIGWVELYNINTDSATVLVDTTKYNEFLIKTGDFANGQYIEYYVNKSTTTFTNNYELPCPVANSGNVSINKFTFTDSSIKFVGASSVQRATIYAK